MFVFDIFYANSFVFFSVSLYKQRSTILLFRHCVGSHDVAAADAAHAAQDGQRARGRTLQLAALQDLRALRHPLYQRYM